MKFNLPLLLLFFPTGVYGSSAVLRLSKIHLCIFSTFRILIPTGKIEALSRRVRRRSVHDITGIERNSLKCSIQCIVIEIKSYSTLVGNHYCIRRCLSNQFFLRIINLYQQIKTLAFFQLVNRSIRHKTQTGLRRRIPVCYVINRRFKRIGQITVFARYNRRKVYCPGFLFHPSSSYSIRFVLITLYCKCNLKLRRTRRIRVAVIP